MEKSDIENFCFKFNSELNEIKYCRFNMLEHERICV